MSITSEISRLQEAKAELKTSIENKGVSVPSSAKLDNYHQYVDAIPTGSTIHNQDKVANPDETQQVITYDSEYTGLGTVTIEPISSDYIGSDVPRRDSSDLSAEGPTVTTPAGYYETDASKSVSSGMVGNPNLVQSKDANYFYETISYPNFQDGYITVAPAVQTHLALENKTVTPSESTQTVNPTGNSYYLDSVTVNPIPSQYIVPTGIKEITENGTGIDVTQYASVDVAVPGEVPNLQDKSVSYTPTESAQSDTVTYDTGYTGLGEVSVNVGAISSDYVGSNVTRRSSSDLSTSGATITAPSGYYANSASATIDSGVQGSPHWYISKGTTTLSANVTFPDATSGYYNRVSGAGYGFNLQDLEVTPTESQQVVTPIANSYYVNSVTVDAIPSDYVGSAIEQRSSSDLSVSGKQITAPAGYYANAATSSVATGTEGTPAAVKSAVSNHSISVTPSVTNTEGYINGGTHTGTAVSVQASELVSGTKTIAENGTGIDVTNYASVDVSIPVPPPVLQNKTVDVTPTESSQSQTVSYDSGYDGLNEVEVNVGAISSTYVGSEITRRSGTDLTSSGATVSVPAGYYEESASKSIASGSATTPATTITANPTISVNTSTGLITATTSASQSVTPTVNAGYVSSGTSGTVTVSGSKTSQLSTQAATTISPTESEQTAVSANKYTLGEVKVGAISSTYVGSEIDRRDSSDLTASGATVNVPSGYYETSASKAVASGSAGTPVATKGTVSNHAISVTPSVTNTTGYISGGTKTGTAVSVSASELVSGTLEVVENDTGIDVTNYASVDVAVPTESVIITETIDAGGGTIVDIVGEVVRNQSKTVTASSNQMIVTPDAGYNGLSQVIINPVAAQTLYVTNSANTNITLEFTGLTKTPAAFFVRCTSTIQKTSSNYYYIITMIYNGTSVAGNYISESAGTISTANSGYSFEYVDGTLTLSSSGSRGVSPGSFYNGTYELTVIY